MKIVKVAALGLLLAAPVQAVASIHRCSEWTDATMRHRGDVIVSLDGDTLTWKSDHWETSAQMVDTVYGAATYSDGAYIYFVFGSGIGSEFSRNRIDLIRRAARTRNSVFGEITCEE